MEAGTEYRIGNDSIYISITCDPIDDDLIIVESTLRVGTDGRIEQTLLRRAVTAAQVKGEVDLHIGMAWCWFDENQIKLANETRSISDDDVNALLASARSLSHQTKRQPQISM